MRAKPVMPRPMTHGNSPERLTPCRHTHRHSGLHFLQVRLTRPAALTALCAPWRRIRADEVLRRRRVFANIMAVNHDAIGRALQILGLR